MDEKIKEIEKEFEAEWDRLHEERKYNYEKTYAKLIYCKQVEILFSIIKKLQDSLFELNGKYTARIKELYEANMKIKELS